MDSIKREVLNTKGNYAEDFNFLGRFSLIYLHLFFSALIKFSISFAFCFFNEVAINRNEVQRISRRGSELPCSFERK